MIESIKTTMVFPDEEHAKRFMYFARKCVKAGATTEDQILGLWKIYENEREVVATDARPVCINETEDGMKLHVQGCHFIGSGRGFSEINGTTEKTYVINGIFIADDDERALAIRVANRRGVWDRIKVAFVVLFARRNNL